MRQRDEHITADLSASPRAGPRATGQTIAPAIAWFHDCDGGELSYWPDGPDAPGAQHRVRFNTAIVLDTDSVFHGVDRIANVAPDDLPRIRPGTTLDCVAPGKWMLHNAAGDDVGSYDWNALRFRSPGRRTVSDDETERDMWQEHRDDLTIDVILDRLVDELCARGVVARDVARDAELGRVLIDEYIGFPLSTTTSTS